MRLASLLLLAAWLGASLLTTAVVAPAAFAVLPSRSLAGALVGRVLPALFLSGVAAGVAAALSAARDRAVGVDAPFVLARLVLAVAVAVACLAAQFGVAPRIARLRADIGPAVDALDRSDPRRRSFGRLHAFSVAALGVAMLAGGAVAVLAALPHSGGSLDSRRTAASDRVRR